LSLRWGGLAHKDFGTEELGPLAPEDGGRTGEGHPGVPRPVPGQALAKGTPRSWLEDGQKVSVLAAPTRYEPITFQVASDLRNKKVEARLDLPTAQVGAKIHLRLRAPEGNQISSVNVDGNSSHDFDPASETITLPAGAFGRKHIVVQYR
jgi:hypothetical protein